MSDDVPETDQSEEKLIAPLRHELLHPIEDMQDENDRQFITALAWSGVTALLQSKTSASGKSGTVANDGAA